MRWVIHSIWKGLFRILRLLKVLRVIGVIGIMFTVYLELDN